MSETSEQQAERLSEFANVHRAAAEWLAGKDNGRQRGSYKEATAKAEALESGAAAILENAELKRKVEAVVSNMVYKVSGFPSDRASWCNGASGTFHRTQEEAKSEFWISVGITPEPSEPTKEEQ